MNEPQDVSIYRWYDMICNESHIYLDMIYVSNKTNIYIYMYRTIDSTDHGDPRLSNTSNKHSIELTVSKLVGKSPIIFGPLDYNSKMF